MPDKRPQISIILTVHNSERFLRESLDSVCNQTFKAIEILCIDGGSKDASPEILVEYQMRDERILIINDSNTSYGHKVNIGIQQASADYIGVLEADDVMLPNMLETLYTYVEQEHPDFVNGDYFCWLQINGASIKRTMQIYPQEDYNKLIYNSRHPENMRYVGRFWTGIYKRSFLLEQKIYLNESPGASYQDMSFRFLTNAFADTSYHINIPLYQYRVDNPDSSVKDATKVLTIINEFAYLEKKLKAREPISHFLWRSFYQWKYQEMFWHLKRHKGETKQIFYEHYCQELKRDLSLMPDWSEALYPNTSVDIINNRQETLDRAERLWQEEIAAETRAQELLYRISQEKTVIFGCGIRGKGLYQSLCELQKQILCFGDNRKTGHYESREILNVEQVTKRYPTALYVIANKEHAISIKKQLLIAGIDEARICIYE